MTDPGQSIYLAGPIEADDDPRAWRDEVRERFPEVDWIDPMEWQDEWAEDPSAIWEREMETVRNNPVLVCNVGDEAPRTTGTHHEIREALNHGQPVAIVREGTVSQVYSEIEDVWLYDEVDHAVADLTCPDLVDDGLRADGGPEQADSEQKQCVICGSEEHDGDGWIYHTTDTEVARIQSDGTLERELKDGARPICSHECKDEFADRFLDNSSTGDDPEVRTDGGQSETEFDDRLIYEIWEDRAEENISEWGIQDPAVVLLAMQEELGELTKAYLEATYEGCDRDLPREEMHDLGALLYQLHWALSEHPRAFTEVAEL